MQGLTELRKRKTILEGGYPLKTTLVGENEAAERRLSWWRQ